MPLTSTPTTAPMWRPPSRAGNDIRHGLIGAGVYASHGYERSHIDGVMNTLKVLEGFLKL